MNNQKLHECLDKAFDHFNRQLFEGQLKKCILNFSRQRRALGFFMPRAWRPTNSETTLSEESKVNLIHEISINPDYMTRHLSAEESVKEVFSTLVHEMCHLWQEDHGKNLPKNKRYHNKEWARKMIEVGLHPSTTGQPGGKKTGLKVSHYIVNGGKFEEAYKVLSEEYKFPFLGIGRFVHKKETAKTKNYKCNTCTAKVRGEINLDIFCGRCGNQMQ